VDHRAITDDLDRTNPTERFAKRRDFFGQREDASTSGALAAAGLPVKSRIAALQLKEINAPASDIPLPPLSASRFDDAALIQSP
jgi:hypothetical protein